MFSNVGPPDLSSAGGGPDILDAPQDHATAEVFRLPETMIRLKQNVVQLRKKKKILVFIVTHQ